VREHWPEYVIEAAGLGVFMFVACVFGTLLAYPGSPVMRAVPDGLVRRALMGIVMGLTAIALIYSPFGRRSGAHFNPATTLTFWWLGKVATSDALAYVVAQLVGGVAGVVVAAVALGAALADPAVNYVVTQPGAAGSAAAFVAETVISFVLMSAVLWVSNSQRLARFTGLVAGVLVTLYITIEAPMSGMSMNPARSVASAAPAGAWTALWIYLAAPPLGMLLAAETYARRAGFVYCAKLHHDDRSRCIFRCRHAELIAARGATPSASAPATARIA